MVQLNEPIMEYVGNCYIKLPQDEEMKSYIQDTQSMRKSINRNKPYQYFTTNTFYIKEENGNFPMLNIKFVYTKEKWEVLFGNNQYQILPTLKISKDNSTDPFENIKIYGTILNYKWTKLNDGTLKMDDIRNTTVIKINYHNHRHQKMLRLFQKIMRTLQQDSLIMRMLKSKNQNKMYQSFLLGNHGAHMKQFKNDLMRCRNLVHKT